MIDTASRFATSPAHAEPGVALATARRRFPIAGVDFDLVTPQAVLQAVLEWRNLAARHSISMVNPHSVLLCRRDPEMRVAIANSGLTLPDGVGIVVGARLLSYPHRGRVSGPELMLYLCDRGREHGLRHFFYGGGDGVAQTLARNLRVQFPDLLVAGTHTPPFRNAPTEEEPPVIHQINQSRADILWVGLGAPKQEKWIERNRHALRCSSVIGVGAAFDFHSGQIPWCPAPVRRMGLEWAYRLLHEPGRLWRRNLDSFIFLAAVARQRLGDLARTGSSHPVFLTSAQDTQTPAHPVTPAAQPVKAKRMHA
jgi:N-acetylglucosaminyldiphosphoundecaprenol N-acetyl-beta-D-mannosaminyltransferase